MIPRRIDSLFLRLLLAQASIVACALLIFGGLLMVQRNQLVAPHFASQWAPRIAAAVAANPAGLAAKPDPDIQRHEALPAGFKIPVTQMPAVADFTRELQKHGLLIDEAWFLRQNGHFELWVHIRAPGAAPVWLSGPVATSLLPNWTPRMSLGIAFMALMIGWMSWAFARRVTRPLEQLRAQMHSHALSGVQASPHLAALQVGVAPPELIEIDNAYRLLAERLQRNERERALLLAGVSHDLRSPLSRIRLAAEMLPETAANAAGVASITRNVDHADRLTASFLEFVRAGSVELNERVDLAAAVQVAVAGFERSEAELKARTPDSLQLHAAHGLLIERLIVNLIDNALKHGGVPVEVELVQEGEAAVLTVSDNGPGLPKGGAGRLMDAFARGDASRGLPGFGLGLAIAQQTLLRLGGSLDFSQAGGRHLVRARMPLRR